MEDKRGGKQKEEYGGGCLAELIFHGERQGSNKKTKNEEPRRKLKKGERHWQRPVWPPFPDPRVPRPMRKNQREKKVIKRKRRGGERVPTSLGRGAKRSHPEEACLVEKQKWGTGIKKIPKGHAGEGRHSNQKQGWWGGGRQQKPSVN